jgi:hypothetical protein
MSVVYCGDFLQLDPPHNEAVYCKAEAPDTDSRHGQHVWNQVNACISLTESNRTKDPDLEAVLHALRTGEVTPRVEQLIKSRTFGPGDDMDVGSEATALFFTNEKVNSVNQTAPHLDARRLGLHVVRLGVHVTGATMSAQLAEDVRAYTSDNDSTAYIACGDAKDGFLRYVDLYPGMKVTVKDGNDRVEATALGNNAPAVVVGFADASCRFVDTESPTWTQSVKLRGGHDARVQTPPQPSDITYVLLRVDGPIAFRYRGLPPNVIALPRSSVKSAKAGVTFSQFPIRPRKALTVHSAQGQTLSQGVIIDCFWGSRLSYVAVSRATRLSDVVFLMPFDRKKITTQCKIPPSLISELSSLDCLHAKTVAAIDRLAPTIAHPPVLLQHN